jgi:hypothetical protein
MRGIHTFEPLNALYIITYIQGMIKRFLARYASSHYTDIYTQYVDTNILLKITDRVTRGFTHIKLH